MSETRRSPNDFACPRCGVPRGETCINDGTLHGREWHVSRRERADEANLHSGEGRASTPKGESKSFNDWKQKQIVANPWRWTTDLLEDMDRLNRSAFDAGAASVQGGEPQRLEDQVERLTDVVVTQDDFRETYGAHGQLGYSSVHAELRATKRNLEQALALLRTASPAVHPQPDTLVQAGERNLEDVVICSGFKKLSPVTEKEE